MNIQDIVMEVVRRDIPVEIGISEDKKSFTYCVSGFAKSGSVMLYQSGDSILAKARYNEITEITDFEDLARLAKSWYDSYADRGYKIDTYWADVIVELGWLTRKETVVVTYE